MKTFRDEDWAVEYHSDFKMKWPKLMPWIPKAPGARVLDFGCGAGGIMKEMKRINPTATFASVDVSESAVEKGQRLFPKFAFHKIEDGSPLPFHDGTFDFIFSSEVIEHVYDTENAAREMGRVLKRGGRLLMTTPYHGFLKNLIITLIAFDSHFDPTGPHVRFFSRKTLRRLLEKNGFRIVKETGYGRRWPFLKSMVVLAEKI